MPGWPIDIYEFCFLVWRQHCAEEKRISACPNDVAHDRLDEKPRQLDAVADYIGMRTGEGVPAAQAYVQWAGRGGAGPAQHWPNWGQIVGRISAYFTPDRVAELVRRYCTEYPEAAHAMGMIGQQGGTSEPETGPEGRMVRLAKAMLHVQDHPEWSDRTIASKLGVSPSTLSRDRTYRAAAAAARGQVSHVRRGISLKHDDGQFTIDGVDELETDPETDSVH